MATRTVAAKTAVRTNKTNNTAINMAATTKKCNERIPAPTRKALPLLDTYSKTDVNGSYTGKPKDEKEMPVQDADDL